MILVMLLVFLTFDKHLSTHRKMNQYSSTHIENERIVLITIKKVITRVQIRYNLFYKRANKLYDC